MSNRSVKIILFSGQSRDLWSRFFPVSEHRPGIGRLRSRGLARGTSYFLGRIGFPLVLASLVLAIVMPIVARNMVAPIELTALIGIAIAGRHLHAKLDFSVQAYSLLLLFILEFAVLARFANNP